MPPSSPLVSIDYTPDNADAIAHAVSQANHWRRVRAALVRKGLTSGRGIHLATSRIGVWTSIAARAS